MSQRLAAIVLAAGFGRRFGGSGKLHALLDGEPVLKHSLQALAGLALLERLVVVAPGDASASELASACGARTIVNPDRAAGLGNSLACGARALSPDADGVMVLLGDMPRIRSATLQALAERWRGLGRNDLLAPTFQGRRGHPVIFGADYWPALCQLEGEQGARDVLTTHRAKLELLAVDDAGVLVDIDTPADLAAAGEPSDRPKA